jgi:hypothetical protein
VMQCLEKEAQHRPRAMDEVLVRLKLAKAELGGRSSGITVMSDDRNSMPEEAAISDPPQDLAELPVTRAMHARPRTGSHPAPRPVEQEQPAPHPITQPSFSSSSQIGLPTWSLGASLEGAIGSEDSTRPTRILGHMSKLGKPPRRPWAAILVGVVLGVVVLVAGGAWRLGLLDGAIDAAVDAVQSNARTRIGPPQLHAGGPTPVVARGPLAKKARLRITTEPPGADVLEDHDGLPRLLGTTPLTLPWDVDSEPGTRRLTLRKAGYVAASATVEAPGAQEREPVVLDVAAQLRPLPGK